MSIPEHGELFVIVGDNTNIKKSGTWKNTGRDALKTDRNIGSLENNSFKRHAIPSGLSGNFFVHDTYLYDVS